VNLEIGPIDAIVVGDDHRRQLHILVADGLKRPIELADDQVETAENLPLQLLRSSRN